MDDFKKQLYIYAGERLRRARMVKGLTQTELSQILGYADSTTIYKIEKGLQKIPNAKMHEICNALGIDYAYLTDGFDFTFDVNGHPVVIEKNTTDKRRNDLMHRINELLYTASESQLSQIAGILEILINGGNYGASDME